MKSLQPFVKNFNMYKENLIQESPIIERKKKI